MKRKTSNKVKILIAAGLIAILGIGGIRAYMTDHGMKQNSFTVGKVDFNLFEKNWDGELPDGSYATPSTATPSEALGINQAQDIYSGKVINKDPAIKNNSRNDAYLRMSVKIPVAEVVTAAEDGTVLNGGIPTETELFTYKENPGTGMRRVSATPRVETATSSNAVRVYHVYDYQYTGDENHEIPLPAGQDIPPLFSNAVFANVIEGYVDEETEFITVDFKAIQSGGFKSAYEAWAAYEKQNPKRE